MRAPSASPTHQVPQSVPANEPETAPASSSAATPQLALTPGATFVARGFSGDKTQLVPLIKAAVEHKGAAFLDVISPCVAFNNHPGSTKSYDYVREHNEAVNRLDFMPDRAPIVASPAPGGVQDVLLHDGGTLRLRKLAPDYDPRDKLGAMSYLESRRVAGEVVTGLLYVHPDSSDMLDAMAVTDTPLNALDDAALIPGAAALAAFNDSLR